LSAFPLNILFMSRTIKNGVQISGSALYEPEFDTYRKDGDVSSMRYHNIYGTTSHLVIAYDEKNKRYRGERFFAQLTMPGLANGERCKFSQEKQEAYRR
jgi:hypothetical protein